MKCAFKEWALVCEALGTGQQSLIVRKGGIAEGREGFAFRENEFVLFPTWFHEQLARTRLPRDTPLPPEPVNDLEIRYAASVEWSGMVTDLSKIRALESLHILDPSVIEERFHYSETRGLHVAFVRIFRLEPPKQIRMEKKYGGCRSWVDLPEIDDCALVSVLSEREHIRRFDLLRKILGC